MSAADPLRGGRRCLDAVLWTGAWSGILLPVLSHTGHVFWGLEYLTVLVLCLGLGLFCSLTAFSGTLQGLLLVCVVQLNAFLYFAPMLFQGWGGALWAGASLLFVMLCWRQPVHSLRMAGVCGGVQAVLAALCMPPAASSFVASEPRPLDSTLPAVVHMVLDEHSGVSTVPIGSEAAEAMQDLVRRYLAQGFVVFTKAYAVDPQTYKSVARLFNPAEEPLDALWRSNHGRFETRELKLMGRIGEHRGIDATYISYVDMSSALHRTGALHRERAYDYGLGAPEAAVRFGMPWDERLTLAFWRSLDWFDSAARCPLFERVFHGFERRVGQWEPFAGEIGMRPYSLTSALELEQFCQRLKQQAAPGMYYYGHFVLPHHPFIFDRTGRLLPYDQWRLRVVQPAEKPDPATAYRERYRLHMEQALFACGQVLELSTELARTLRAPGPVLIVHGDHGSRIEHRFLSPLYTAADRDRDMRATFLAVKIPGRPGGLVEKPVRLDQVFEQLVDRGFLSLDPEALRTLPDQPFLQGGPP